MIDGNEFATDEDSVFSTGTWRDGAATPGFGRGNTLHVNGYFQYSDSLTSEQYVVVDQLPGDAGTLVNDPFTGRLGGIFNDANRIKVAVYNADGSLSNSFGDNGKVDLTSIDSRLGPEFIVEDLNFMPDGSILLVGRNFNFVGVSVPYLMKLNADGSFDSNFAANGLLQNTNLGIEQSDNGKFEAVIDSDGGIALVGNVWNSDSDYHLRYLDALGNLDTSRGFSGELTIFPGAGDTDLQAVIPVGNDGSLIFTFNRRDPNSNRTTTWIAKIDALGVLDEDFGNDSIGVSTVTPAAEFSFFNKFALDNQNRLVMVSDGEVTRLTAAGQLDDSFGTFSRFGYRDDFTVENAGERVRFDRLQSVLIDSQDRIVFVVAKCITDRTI